MSPREAAPHERAATDAGPWAPERRTAHALPSAPFAYSDGMFLSPGDVTPPRAALFGAPRGRHTPAASLSSLGAVSPITRMSSPDPPSEQRPVRGRSRAGTLPSHWGAVDASGPEPDAERGAAPSRGMDTPLRHPMHGGAARYRGGPRFDASFDAGVFRHPMQRLRSAASLSPFPADRGLPARAVELDGGAGSLRGAGGDLSAHDTGDLAMLATPNEDAAGSLVKTLDYLGLGDATPPPSGGDAAPPLDARPPPGIPQRERAMTDAALVPPTISRTSAAPGGPVAYASRPGALAAAALQNRLTHFAPGGADAFAAGMPPPSPLRPRATSMGPLEKPGGTPPVRDESPGEAPPAHYGQTLDVLSAPGSVAGALRDMPPRVHPPPPSPPRAHPSPPPPVGGGRMRADTIVALSGPDGRLRTELELQRAQLGITADPRAAADGHSRLRSMSAHASPRGHANGSAAHRTLCIEHLCGPASTRVLLRLFEPYGPITDIQLFPHQGAALVQFQDADQARQALEAAVAFIGAYLVEMLPEQTGVPVFSLGGAGIGGVGVGGAGALGGVGADAAPPAAGAAQSRHLLVSALLPNVTNTAFVQHLAAFGAVEYAAMQGRQAQVIFERAEDAEAACAALDGSFTFGAPLHAQLVHRGEGDVWEAKGGAGVPPAAAPGAGSLDAHARTPRRGRGGTPGAPRMGARPGGSGSIVPSSDRGGVPLPAELVPTEDADEVQRLANMLHFATGPDPAAAGAGAGRAPLYHSSIPTVAEGGRANRRFDNARFRELRRTMESGQLPQAKVDAVAHEHMDVIVELASNYIGNTVVQRFFEQCSEEVKTAMLERLAPHLATIGIHKNGTWAAQKIIDCAHTDAQRTLITCHLQAYVPALLLDQFGNYVVQCVLPFGFPRAAFVFDAIVHRCWEIAQGRFGARSMRTCFENGVVPRAQLKRVALAIVLHGVPLATSPNGTLLLTWLFETSGLTGFMELLAPRFVPHLAQLCTHKLASATVLRIVGQTASPHAARLLLDAVFDLPNMRVLEDILLDLVHGSQFIARALQSPVLDSDTHARYVEGVASLLRCHDLVAVPAYRRLAEQVGLPAAPAPGKNLPNGDLLASANMYIPYPAYDVPLERGSSSSSASGDASTVTNQGGPAGHAGLNSYAALMDPRLNKPSPMYVHAPYYMGLENAPVHTDGPADGPSVRPPTAPGME
ncbi:hypothetical protein MSPP1_002387 [Malassezia sp. CBS 17886]|nr:hypothetical protein MSPP1_002387 [Malassezia sp. CBS 17886]